jgi:DNA primase
MIDLDLVTVIENEGIRIPDIGSSHRCICPFHDDKNPSLVVRKDSPGRFYCYGCHAHGDAINFVRLLKDYSFKQAVVYLKVEYMLEGKIKKGERMIDIIAREEREGIDVQKRYGKKLTDTLLAKELVCPD